MRATGEQDASGLDLRARLAAAAGRAVAAANRHLGWGGSTFPGAVALRLDPRLLAKLGRRHPLGNVLVTGTNGKTTTARLLAAAVRAAGFSLVHNRSGANLYRAVVAAFAQAGAGAPPPDLGLAEVDEAAAPAVAADLRPRLVVVTNFFRDQLDRYGELERTVQLGRRGLELLAPGGVAVLNADDPLVAALGEEAGRAAVYFGVDLPGEREVPAVAEARYCPACGARHVYTRVVYAHLGDWRCPGCGRRRPRPEVAVVAAAPQGRSTRLELATPAGTVAVDFPLPGLYNAYNAAAAAAAAFALGLPPEAAARALSSAAASFGRMEAIPVGGREVVVALVKNPAGYDQVLGAVLGGPEPARHLLLAVNDRLADGTDISWLWDVDFECLGPRAADLAWVGASGRRAADLALRLKYAGLPPDLVHVEEKLSRALDAGLAATPAGGRLWVLPTYTALLELRRLLHRRRWAPAFWEV